MADVNKSIRNLIKAIEEGIINKATKSRMDELDKQKSEIETALAAAKLKQNLELTKEHILYFLKRFTDLDYNDLNCQKQLIKTFVNSVFVYENKVVLTFNYSGDDRTITLREIDGGLEHGVRLPGGLFLQQKALALQVLFLYTKTRGNCLGFLLNLQFTFYS